VGVGKATASSRVALLTSAIVSWWFVPVWPYLDDGYIILHSADVVLSGRDAAYGSPALTGVTSPAYLALVVVLELLHVRGAPAIQVANILGLTASLFGSWRSAARFPSPSGSARRCRWSCFCPVKSSRP